MNTKMIMTVCAFLQGMLGIVLSFLPQEIANYLSWPDTQPIILQILGAMYFGFAIVNWTAKANIMGGIYGKPIALGNFAHFVIGALALIKWITQHTAIHMMLVITVIYIIFAIVFGYILFVHPKVKVKN